VSIGDILALVYYLYIEQVAQTVIACHNEYRPMSNELNPKTDPCHSMVYQIKLKGYLGREWTDWFGGLTITLEEDGDTLLTGPVIDQAALHGLLKKVRDLGMPLVSVNQVQFNETHPYRSKKGEKMNTTKENPHGTNRKTSIIVGVLYIIGTVAGILSVVLSTPILDGPDFLIKVSSNETQFVIAALFVLLMGLALAMVPVMLFPIFRKINEVLAIGYVVFRGALETVTSIIVVITWLFILVVGREYVTAGALDASNLQTLGSVLKEGNDFLAPIMGIVFSLGALMLYYVLYQSKLIPRWISGWGFVAILLHLASSFLIMFHLQTAFSTSNMVMNSQIFLQEMVMAVWLIVKGFNQSAIASLSAKVDMS
jgi:hypothetical protein